MHYQETTLKIANGFQIVEHKRTVDIDIAGAMLSTKKQDKFTAAVRNDLSTTLIWHSIRCPYCGHESLAYFDTQTGHRIVERIPKSTVEQWATRQMSLFEDQNKTLSLNRVYYPAGQYVCPECQTQLKKSRRIRQIRFCESKNKLEIFCELLDFSEMFSMTWFMSGMVRFDKTIYETLTFNFGNGHTYIKLENDKGDIFAVSDITTDASRWHDGVIFSLFSNSKIFRRTLKRFFLSKYKGNLPFSVCELSLEKYVLMTRFVGFNRSFYDAIPFGEDKQKIDGSFKSAVKRLRFAEKIPAIYESINLPKMKSVKKLFFTNPGLMFYAKEIKKLWDIFQNPDLLCSLLDCEKTYQLLSDLHMYEGIYRFYDDYIRVKGARALCRLIKKSTLIVHSYAVFYSALNNIQKKREQIKWLKKDFFDEIKKHMDCYAPMLRLSEKYSIPMHAVDERIINCVIDGYSFVWLRNMMEYKRAGNILINCLKGWRCWNNPVVVVYQNQKMLAAIEVDGTKIRQAQLADHHEINENQDLFKAYSKWQERFKLEFHSYEWDDEENVEDDDERWQF